MGIATHPQAKFDPIPPDLDLYSLVDRTPNFEWALRIHASKVRRTEFDQLVYFSVFKQGRPLVIEGWDSKLPKSLFSSQWLEDNYNKKRKSLLLSGSFALRALMLTTHQRKMSVISTLRRIFP